MLEHVPGWLGKVLKNVRAGHGNLTIVKLGGEDLLGKGAFRLNSPAFRDGEVLDPSFTADEEDAVAPPLEWTAPPAGTQELAIVVEDPDAPSPQPFCHWLVWGLAPQAKWSFTSFDATGPVFVDSKTSVSAGSLRSPQ